MSAPLGIDFSALHRPGAHVHVVGIGGVGMSAIARVLMERGVRVTGSDRSDSEYTERLRADSTVIQLSHDPAHLQADPPELVLISSAVRDNPELEAARAAGIPVVRRSEFIAELMRDQQVIAVAGAHGKTTTSAMVIHILLQAGQHPGFILGGMLKSAGTNASAGAGRVFVIEADEYDHMFLGLQPNTAIVTNVDWDHPDFFPTPSAFQRAFEQFIDRLEPSGMLVYSADNPGSAALGRYAAAHARRTTGYWLNAPDRAPSVEVTDSNEHGLHLIFRPDSERVIEGFLPMTGDHHAANALAAVLAVETAGVSSDVAVHALASFGGVGRRFEVIGDQHGVAVVDDYAHNPAKIRAALAAARQRYPTRAIWAIWQPHTFSRTQTFLSEYATAFHAADHVRVTEIYPSREKAVQFPGVSGEQTAAAIDHPDVRYTPTFSELIAELSGSVKAPAAILILSAGDATQLGPLLRSAFDARP
jgi:UDP-N-acetylmuramate--alanine ligase